MVAWLAVAKKRFVKRRNQARDRLVRAVDPWVWETAWRKVGARRGKEPAGDDPNTAEEPLMGSRNARERRI